MISFFEIETVLYEIFPGMAEDFLPVYIRIGTKLLEAGSGPFFIGLRIRPLSEAFLADDEPSTFRMGLGDEDLPLATCVTLTDFKTWFFVHDDPE
jgi:hypothetical protein